MATFARALLATALPLALIAAGCSSSTGTGAGGDGGSPNDSSIDTGGMGFDSGQPTDSSTPLPETGGGDSGGMATCASVCMHASALPCYDATRCNTNCSTEQGACNASGQGSQFQSFLNCSETATPACDSMNRVTFPSCTSLAPPSCNPPTDGGVTDTTCQMMATAATCVGCCDSLHPQGLQAFAQDLSNCECAGDGGMGICQTPCATELCANPPVQPMTGDACDTCVKGSLNPTGGSGACVNPVFTACTADTNCNAYFNCISGCPTM